MIRKRTKNQLQSTPIGIPRTVRRVNLTALRHSGHSGRIVEVGRLAAHTGADRLELIRRAEQFGLQRLLQCQRLFGG